MVHLIRQRLLQRTLCHARVVQIAKTASHARRPFAASFLCHPPLPGRKHRQRWSVLLLLLLGLRLDGGGGGVGGLW